MEKIKLMVNFSFFLLIILCTKIEKSNKIVINRHKSLNFDKSKENS